MMTSENFLEHAMDTAPVAPDLSVSTAFHDAYDKTVRVIGEHPIATVVDVACAVAVGAAAVYFSRGEALFGVIGAGERGAVGAAIVNQDVKAASLAIGKPASRIFAQAEDGTVRSIVASTETQATDAMDPFKAFDQTGYKFLPMRSLVTGIRTGDGAALRSVDGQSRIVLGGDNSVQHILLNKGAGPEARADLLMQAGYAGLLKNDVLAAQAASKTGDGIFGFLKRAVDGPATAADVQQNAIDGARAYVGMDMKAANPYTRYLTERFGPMTKETQTWGRHIINTPESPESPWNVRAATATDTLVQNGLPITPLNRAVAANPSVMKAEPWLREPAIKGGAKYLEATAAQALPGDASAMVKDAWYGAHAGAMPPEVVKTVGSVTLAFGPEASANTAIIDKVANMLSSAAQPEEYVGAYSALAKGNELVEALAKLGK